MILTAFAISLPLWLPLSIPALFAFLSLLAPIFGTIYLLGTNQSPKLPTGFINSAGGDPGAGVPLLSPSGSIVQQYLGQVGGKLSLDTTQASGLSDPANNTLFAGVYQYVQFASGATASNARGQIVFWLTAASYIVTADVTTATQGLIAGITLAAVTKGNYGWIQIQGRAMVRFKTGITKATPAAGDLVVVDQTPTFAADVLADATQLTSVTAKSIVGVADSTTAPTSNTISAVDLAFFMNGWRY